MTASFVSLWTARVLKMLPRPLHDSLDAWSYRLAVRQRAARLQRGWRKTAPLRPVIAGRVALPQSFSS